MRSYYIFSPKESFWYEDVFIDSFFFIYTNQYLDVDKKVNKTSFYLFKLHFFFSFFVILSATEVLE